MRPYGIARIAPKTETKAIAPMAPPEELFCPDKTAAPIKILNI